MSELEEKIEARLVTWLKKNKIKYKKKAYGELLDRWIFLPGGKLFIIELKRPEGYLKRRQEIEISVLRRLGYDIEVHDNEIEAIEAIGARLEATRLSKEGHEDDARKLLARSLSRSRARENKYHSRMRKTSNRKKND